MPSGRSADSREEQSAKRFNNGVKYLFGGRYRLLNDNNFVKIQEYDAVLVEYVKEINKYFRVYVVIDLLNDNKLGEFI